MLVMFPSLGAGCVVCSDRERSWGCTFVPTLLLCILHLNKNIEQAPGFKSLKLDLRSVGWDFQSFAHRSEIRMGEKHLLESAMEGWAVCLLGEVGGHLLAISMLPIGCKL